MSDEILFFLDIMSDRFWKIICSPVVIHLISVFVNNIAAFGLDIIQEKETSDTLFLTFSAFLFVYCFIWMECPQFKSINCCYHFSWKITCTKLTQFLWWIPTGRLFSTQMCKKIFEEKVWNSKYKHVSLCVFLRDIAILQ